MIGILELKYRPLFDHFNPRIKLMSRTSISQYPHMYNILVIFSQRVTYTYYIIYELRFQTFLSCVKLVTAITLHVLQLQLTATASVYVQFKIIKNSHSPLTISRLNAFLCLRCNFILINTRRKLFINY